MECLVNGIFRDIRSLLLHRITTRSQPPVRLGQYNIDMCLRGLCTVYCIKTVQSLKLVPFYLFCNGSGFPSTHTITKFDQRENYYSKYQKEKKHHVQRIKLIFW